MNLLYLYSVIFSPVTGETEHLKLKSEEVDCWDLAYLKFCCKVQGIRNELFASDTCKVVALEEIKGHFPQVLLAARAGHFRYFFNFQ